MYPDEQSAFAYTVLAEFIAGNGVSKKEAYQALSTISERVRELSGGLTPDAADLAKGCANCEVYKQAEWCNPSCRDYPPSR